MSNEKEYEDELRKRILEKIEDLKQKIKTNEDFPESSQNVDSLCDTEDALDEILSCWYY